MTAPNYIDLPDVLETFVRRDDNHIWVSISANFAVVLPLDSEGQPIELASWWLMDVLLKHQDSFQFPYDGQAQVTHPGIGATLISVGAPLSLFIPETRRALEGALAFLRAQGHGEAEPTVAVERILAKLPSHPLRKGELDGGTKPATEEAP